ncbi:MAG: PilZ domain-containing protein [Holophagales bacterium]|nr:PilZ domain-containing protein [Holophagales bacterium]
MNEKRTFSRLKKRLLVDIAVEGRTASGFTWDISHTGLSISSQYVPKLGEHLRTVLHLPKGKTVECHGTVVRVRRVPLALADELGGSGFCLALGGYFEEYSRFLGDLK